LVDVSSCQRQGRSAGLLGPQAAAVRPPGALSCCDCFPGQQQFDHPEHFAVVIDFLGLLPIGDADAIGTADIFLVIFTFNYIQYVYVFFFWDWVAFLRFSFAIFLSCFCFLTGDFLFFCW